MTATYIFALELFLTLLSLSRLQRNCTIKTLSNIQGFSDGVLLRNNDLEMSIFSTNIQVASRLSRYDLVRRTITTWTKHGLLVVKPKEHEICLNLCICMDVEANESKKKGCDNS